MFRQVSDTADWTPNPPSRRRVALFLVCCAVIVTAFLWRPLAGFALAGLGLGYLLFRHTRIDATAIVTLYLALLTLIAPSYVIPGTGAAGAPATVLAIGGAYWWMLVRTVPRPAALDEAGPQAVQPLRIALIVLLFTSLSAFVAAFSRPLTSVEANGAVRNVISIVGFVGIALLVSDGMTSTARLNRLLNSLLTLGAVLAVIGGVQYFTDLDPVARWPIPGLEMNRELETIEQRSVVDRVASTTFHPIEFGAVLAMLFPLALHSALYGGQRWKVWRWTRLLLICGAFPLSVSRTAVLVAAVALAMMWTAWTWRRRLLVLASAVAFALALRAVASGLLGTILALFTYFDEDPSTQGRTEDYDVIESFFLERPVFGRGLGTLDPGLYFYLDNQLLGTLVTGGLVGLIGLLGLVITAVTVARQAFWHAPDESSRHLGAALAASIVGGFAGFFTFDALGFPVFTGVFFVIMGLAGALWRLEVQPHGRTFSNPRSRRRSGQLVAADGENAATAGSVPNSRVASKG